MAHMNHAGRTIDFDVTNLMINLQNAESLGARTTVTFVPVGPTSEGSAPVITGGVDFLQHHSVLNDKAGALGFEPLKAVGRVGDATR